MSEQNILNPVGSGEMNPDYAWSAGLPQMHARFQAKSGLTYSRQIEARGRIYDLAWGKRPKATADLIRQWEAQYRNDFFTFYDAERARYFSGIFAAPLQESPAGNDQWNLHAQFVELPGLPMYAFSNNWFGNVPQDSIFLEERDGFGNELVKLTGAWGYVTGIASYHGGNGYVSNTLNDIAEWLYFGYGFRLWSQKGGNLGIVAVSVDGGAETNIDLYSAVAVNQAVTTVNLTLGFHRVKIRVTHTKNAASTDYYCIADAIEVMQ